jgi:hypothetical protein
MKSIRAAFFILLLVLLHLFAPYTASAQLRIVCIGNSITQGKIGLKGDSSYEYSYRPWLWEKLIRSGFKVDMVGFHPYFFDEKEGSLSMTFEANGLAFDRDCEAYYGITSDAFVNGSESTGYAPDIALIHIGTNDPDSTVEQVEATRRNIAEIIRVVRGKNPAVVVIIAKLITGWKKINMQVDAICQEWHTEKSPVISVDMATGFINDPKVEGTMTYDHVHPNKAGQLFMMERWYDAIVQNLKDTVPPSIAGKLQVVHKSRNRATISWRAANDNYGIKAYEVVVNGQLLTTLNQNIHRYTLKGLHKGRQYKIVVRAKDWSGNSSKRMVAIVR